MSTSRQPEAGSVTQFVRLLQIGIVLEEIAETRAARHARNADSIDGEVRAFLEDAAADSARHRRRIERLIERLDAATVRADGLGRVDGRTVDSGKIERLVDERDGTEQGFDGVLYDHLCSEETAYKFYDDLITAVENSAPECGVDRAHLLSVLEALRAEEAAGVEEVTELMQRKLYTGRRNP